MACEGCCYWSEMVAQSIGGDPVEAMCLNDNSDSYQKMVRNGCHDKEWGEPIDFPRPPEDPSE